MIGSSRGNNNITLWRADSAQIIISSFLLFMVSLQVTEKEGHKREAAELGRQSDFVFLIQIR